MFLNHHDQLLARLQYADSYSRGAALVALSRANHPRLPELLGDEWSLCDHYPRGMTTVLGKFQRAPALRSRAMSQVEQDFLAALPAQVTVWRGCYAGNRAGYSWTTQRKVAERFPFLLRYRRSSEGPPLLLQGELARDDVLFVKLDRNEYEVVALPSRVRVVGESVIERDPAQAVEVSA